MAAPGVTDVFPLSEELPPLGQQLPSWSRISFTSSNMPTKAAAAVRSKAITNVKQTTVVPTAQDVDRDPRVQNLLKNIQFIQHQHQEILLSLHDEIRDLKNENQELKFQMMLDGTDTPSAAKSISPGGDQITHKKSTSHVESKTKSGAHHVSQQKPGLYHVEPSRQEDDRGVMKKLRNDVSTLRTENQCLKKQIEQLRKKHDLVSVKENSSGSATKLTCLHPCITWTLNPLRLTIPNTAARVPTISECELIIGTLQQKNERQRKELENLKSNLQGILRSNSEIPQQTADGSSGKSKPLQKSIVPHPPRSDYQSQSVLPRISQAKQQQILKAKSRDPGSALSTSQSQQPTTTLPSLQPGSGQTRSATGGRPLYRNNNNSSGYDRSTTSPKLIIRSARKPPLTGTQASSSRKPPAQQSSAGSKKPNAR